MSDAQYEEIPVQGRAIKIYFCSHCNQSIPLFEIESGEAVERRGAYYCSNCRHLLKPDARSGRGVRTGLLTVLFLAAAAVVIGYFVSQSEWFRTPRKAAAKAEPPPPDNREVLASLERVQERLREIVATQTGRMQDSLDSRFRDLAARLEKNESALARLTGQIEALEARGEQAPTRANLALIQGQVKVQVGQILSELQGIRGEINRLERPPAAAPAAVKPEPAPAPKAEAAPAKAEPVNEPATGLTETDLWILRLKDKNLDERRRAVAALAHFRGPKVEEALIEALKDWSPTIRGMAAIDLGERKAPAAIKPLLKVLEDANTSVRESGVQALRKITGRSFGYKPDASDRKRTQAIERWRGFVSALTRKKE